MIRYVSRRLVTAAATVLVVISLSFFMIRLMPGNPYDSLEGQLEAQGGLTPQQVQQQVNAIYDIRPHSSLVVQYLDYIGNVVRGRLGRSVTDPSQTVAHIIGSALPWTVFVVGVALLLSFAIGILVGAAMAAFQDTLAAKGSSVLVSFASAVPNYLIALVLLYFLGDRYHVFPLGGAYDVSVSPGLNISFLSSVIDHAVLPIASYVLASFGGWALAMKGTAVSVLGADYVRAAESHGLSSFRLATSYVGRNSLLPQVTSLALSIGLLFGGSVLIETYFNYPGIGYYLNQAVTSRDYSVMMGCFLIIAIAVVIANLCADLLYPLLDPRIARPGVGQAVAVAGGGVA
jgi:peptide/nickel transport system permease protein